MKLSEAQWEKLSAFIKSEAEYAAGERFNVNDCSEVLRRRQTEEEAKQALMGDGE